ncbi:hypothetical protein [Actinomadura monticuli]|uniref:hypothetical protein n=1 Tax=Actinomadura monticuli TaxID=3097367 RepID=UPI00356B5E3B
MTIRLSSLTHETLATGVGNDGDVAVTRGSGAGECEHEPTSNLDIASVERLAEALDAYRGALLVVSHDFTFLDRIGVDTVVELGEGGRMRQRRDLDD